MGLHRAGFDVEGWDIRPQKNYPFKFNLGNALEADLSEFDCAWASPPCQSYAITNNIWKKPEGHYPDLVAPTRVKLMSAGIPWIIENVPGAPLINPLTLCGRMFGLRVYRHRLFESSEFILAPPHHSHSERASYGRTPKGDEFFTISGHFGDVEGGRKAMGIDWMTREELSQSIPPAYSEYLGREMMKIILATRRIEA